MSEKKNNSILFERWQRLLRRESLRDFLPWMAYDPRSQLFLMEGGYMGACYEAGTLSGCDASVIAEFHAALAQDMPAGTIIQFLQLNVPDISWHLHAFMRAREKTLMDNEIGEPQRSALSTAADKTAEHFEHMAKNGAFSDSHVVLSDTRLIVSVKIPASEVPTDSQIAAAQDRLNAFEGALQAIRPRRLDEAGLLVILRRMFHIDRSDDDRVVPDTLLRDQVLYAGDGFYVVPGGATITSGEGERHMRVLSTRFFPKQMGLDIMNAVVGDPMGVRTQFTMPYAISLTITIPDQVDERRSLDRQYAAVNYQAQGPLIRWVPKLGLRKQGYDVLMSALDQGDRALQAGMCFIIWCPDEKSAELSPALIQGYLASLGFTVALDRYLGAVQFLNSMPLLPSQDSLHMTSRQQHMASSHVSQLLPVLGDWAGQIAGPHLNSVSETGAGTLLVSRRGHPVWVDPFATTGNYNFIIAGDSGSGKTFFANQLLLDHLESGGQAWVIEIGRGFEKLCSMIDGDHIRMNESSTFGLNPFTSVRDIDEEIDELTAIFGAMIDPSPDVTFRAGLTPEDMSIVREAVRAVWGARSNDATPDDVANYLYRQDQNPRAQAMARMMGEFTINGAYGHWFNKPMDVDLRGRFVVLELGDLSSRKHLQIVVLLQFMFAIQREIQDKASVDSRRRMLFVDEASELLKIKAAAEFMEGAARRVRKSRGSIGIGIQRVDDLYLSEYTKIIASQAESYYLLKQRPETVSAIEREGRLSLDLWGYTMLRSVRRTTEYSEVMIYQGGGYVIGRLSVDPFRRVLFSSSGAERDGIFRLMEAGLSAGDAIKTYLENEFIMRSALT